MQHKKRDIQPAPTQDSEALRHSIPKIPDSPTTRHAVALKPTPPDDLWQQIDVALAVVAPSRPPNSFTRAEFQERKGLTESTAKRYLRTLCKAGKVKAVGVYNNRYYVLVK